MINLTVPTSRRFFPCSSSQASFLGLLVLGLIVVLGSGPLAAGPWDDEGQVKGVTRGRAEQAESGSFFSAAAMQALPLLAKIPAFKDLPKEPAARVQAWRQIIHTLLAEPGAEYAAAGSCEAYAVKLIQRLGTEGYPLYYAQTTGVGRVIVRGQEKPLDKIHVFVVDRALCAGEGDDPREILIDPTWTQFFEPGECLFPDSREAFLANGGTWDPKDILTRLPVIFVGTRAEISQTYRLYQARLRSAQTSGVDPDWGTYDPASLASLHYSFGRNADLRTNILMSGN